MSQSENISSEEVEKFNDLAREWWNPHGSFAPLHKLNPLRFEYIRAHTELLDDHSIGNSIADELATKCI